MEPKKYEEFIDSTDVLASGINPLLDKTIRELLDPMMVVSQLIGKDTSLMNETGGTKTFRKEDSRLVAISFEEDADIPDICNADFDTVDVTPDYFGGGCPLTAQAIMDFDKDKSLIQWSLRRLARAMAITSDSRIIEELLNVTEVTDNIAGGGTEFTLSHGQENDTGEAIIAVVSVEPTTVGVTWELDYYRGIIVFSEDPGATDVKYYFASDRKYVQALTDGALSYEDVVNCRVSTRVDFVTTDGVLVDELGQGDLLKDDKFIDASAFGEQVMRNGEIGRVAGMPVYVTDTMYDMVMVVAKWGQEIGTVVYKEKIKSEVQKMDKRPGDVWVQSWEKSKPVIVQPDWMRILVNGQVNAAKFVGPAP